MARGAWVVTIGLRDTREILVAIGPFERVASAVQQDIRRRRQLFRAGSGVRRRIRQRNELMTLSDYELSDFICSRSDARAEASKWFWQT